MSVNDGSEFTRTLGYPDNEKGSATEIVFEGVGKVILGNNKESGCMYNWIQVEMEPNLPAGEGLHKLQQMLTTLGLGPVLGQQTSESDERMKIAQLVRAFYPSLSAEKKDELIQYLLAEMIAKDIEGHICIGTHKADDFIHAAVRFKPEMWST
jgi:hypothetical protein